MKYIKTFKFKIQNQLNIYTYKEWPEVRRREANIKQG